jgi:hypothetical protein
MAVRLLVLWTDRRYAHRRAGGNMTGLPTRHAPAGFDRRIGLRD